MPEGVTVNQVAVNAVTVTVTLTLTGPQAQQLLATGRLEGLIAEVPELKGGGQAASGAEGGPQACPGGPC
jgi:hypothetical protein